MKKKSKYFFIIFLLMGTINFLLTSCGDISYKSSKNKENYKENVILDEDEIDIKEEEKNEGSVILGEFDIKDMEKIENIIVDIDSADINIIKSKKSKVEYRILSDSQNDKPICEMANNSLAIKYLHKKYSHSDENREYINIFIDTDKQLNNCNISTNAGSITIEEFLLNDPIIKSNNGDIMINGEIVGKEKISVNAGDIMIKDCFMDNAEITSNAGDIMVNGELTGRGNLSTNAGNIMIKNCCVDDADINVQNGDIVINLLKDLENYNYDFSTVNGSIYINEKEYGRNKDSSGKNNNSENNLKISALTGDINITYK